MRQNIIHESKTDTHIQQIETNVQMVELDAIASIRRAPLFKSQRGANGTTFRVASIKDFPVAGYLPEPERSVVLTSHREKARRHVLQPYDVLVITVGSIGHVTVVPSDCGDNWIPATNMYVIRLKEEPEQASRALYAIFKSPSGESMLQGLARGRGIQIVPKKIFARIQVPQLTPAVLAETERLWDEETTLFRESVEKLRKSREVFHSLRIGMAEPTIS
jgi:hypothetical protein